MKPISSSCGIAGVICAAIATMNIAVGAQPKASGVSTDFSGVWAVRFMGQQPKGTPPYNAKYLALYKESSALVASAKLDLGGTCAPPGMPRIASYIGQFELLNAPAGRITILYEFETQVRRIQLNTARPDYVNPSPNGTSIGHWEANALVVETVGIGEFSYLDDNAGVHSEQLKVTERMRLQDPKTMVIDTTVEDALALTTPWKYSRTYDRSTDAFLDYECNENPRNPVNPDGSLGYTFKSTTN
jgi:hypothetical protein